MPRPFLAVFALLLANLGTAQSDKIPVSVSRTGDDKIGSLFEAALNREISKSTIFVPGLRDGSKQGLSFYIELATVGIGDGRDSSAVSVVVEDMGFPGSFPVATKWYHKVVVVNSKTLNTLAMQLLRDIDAHWCNTIHSSIGHCPKEVLPPIYP